MKRVFLGMWKILPKNFWMFYKTL